MATPKLQMVKSGSRDVLFFLFLLLSLKDSNTCRLPPAETDHTAVICNNILELDCSIFPETISCDTDGITHTTACGFAQRHCRSPEVHVRHSGACTTAEEVIGGQTAGEMQGLSVVLQLVCDDIHHVDCAGQPRSLLCANDDNTYENQRRMRIVDPHRDVICFVATASMKLTKEERLLIFRIGGCGISARRIIWAGGNRVVGGEDAILNKLDANNPICNYVTKSNADVIRENLYRSSS